MEHETWIPIPCESGYEASSLGRVRSVDRVVQTASGPQLHRGNVRVPTPWTKGYLYLWLPGGRSRSVHTLVLEAFAGPRPDGMEGCHEDGDPANNRIDNLRWDTPANNRLDSVRHGTHNHGRKTHCPRNHPLAMPNLDPRPWQQNGWRTCLACRRARSQRDALAAKGVVADLQALSDKYYEQILAVTS